MAKYRTKSTYIEAVKFTRTNIEEVRTFTNGKADDFHIPYNIEGQASCKLKCRDRILDVMENKYIVKTTNDNFYICSEESFEKIYEKEKGE